MSDESEYIEKPPRPRRPGECDPGKHRWSDTEENRRKLVRCVQCGKLYGFYDTLKSPSCVKLIK